MKLRTLLFLPVPAMLYLLLVAGPGVFGAMDSPVILRVRVLEWAWLLGLTLRTSGCHLAPGAPCAPPYTVCTDSVRFCSVSVERAVSGDLGEA